MNDFGGSERPVNIEAGIDDIDRLFFEATKYFDGFKKDHIEWRPDEFGGFVPGSSEEHTSMLKIDGQGMTMFMFNRETNTKSKMFISIRSDGEFDGVPAAGVEQFGRPDRRLTLADIETAKACFSMPVREMPGRHLRYARGPQSVEQGRPYRNPNDPWNEYADYQDAKTEALQRSRPKDPYWEGYGDD